jgi:uncharacterized protein (TIGR02246 family)
MAPSAATLQAFARAYAEAWSSGSPAAVARFFTADGQITVNRGAPSVGRAALEAMAAGFFAEFPGLIVRCDDVRGAGDHALFAWTLEGRHAESRNQVRIHGWEEWELAQPLAIRASLGWFDAAEYERQIREGG